MASSAHAPPTRVIALLLALSLGSAGCFRGGGRMFEAMAWTAIVTTAIVSANPPPPPPVVVVGEPQARPGYSWQPGYWSREDGDWVWNEGVFVRNYPGYWWSPPRWVEDRDNRWRLIPGQWVAVGR